MSSTSIPLQVARAAIKAAQPPRTSLPRKLPASPAKAFSALKPRISPTRKTRTNLNTVLSSNDHERTSQAVTITQPVHIMFQGIRDAIAAKIRDTPYVVGCMAWFSDPVILTALAGCRGVSFVVTNDSLLNSVSLRKLYGALTPLDATRSAVRCVGLRTGSARSLMHHKFIVGLDAARVPAWLAMGSYNASSQAGNNIESVVLFQCPAIARVYFDEYAAIEKSSKPLLALRVK